MSVESKHPGGRPRTVSFSPEEMISLGREMIEWVKKNEQSVLHLSEWYTIEKEYTYNEWKQFISKEEFRPYYEKALKIVGRKYLDKDSKVRDGISQRWQRVYFKDLREEEDETARFNASLKAPEQEKHDSDHMKKMTDFFDSITQAKSKKSDA